MSDDLEKRTEHCTRKFVIVNKSQYSLEPMTKAEQVVYEVIKNSMGSDDKAIEEFKMLSKEFTIPENTQHYRSTDFLSARARYIYQRFKQELEIWPSH